MHFEFCDAAPGAAAVTHDEALRKLAAFYEISDVAGALSEVMSVSGARRPMWYQFKKQNKLGFLNGILTHAPDPLREEYAAKFFWTFGSPALPAPDTDEEWRCLELLYDRFIEPFKGNRSSNGSSHDSTASSREGSLDALDLNAVDPTRANFQAALHKRDKVCLFCWGNLGYDAVQIIAQKSSPTLTFAAADLLKRAKLGSVHQVQMAFCCAKCATQNLMLSGGTSMLRMALLWSKL
ncbi:hypothetical protein HDU84_001462 [Entophlyctis sp. JEL0112]|nr:hypothetical protein HDU84_001462 [Entophlyctis sp. JEL0112]